VEELISVADGLHKPLSSTFNASPQQLFRSPFTEIVRQEVVDDSLQQARLKVLLAVPGLNQ